MWLVSSHEVALLSADLPSILDARTSGLAIEADYTFKQISTSTTHYDVSCGLYQTKGPLSFTVSI
jgi:hypothetical protein